MLLLAFLSIVNGWADRFGRRGDQRVKRISFRMRVRKRIEKVAKRQRLSANVCYPVLRCVYCYAWRSYAKSVKDGGICPKALAQLTRCGGVCPVSSQKYKMMFAVNDPTKLQSRNR